jgi:hypothetical protein
MLVTQMRLPHSLATHPAHSLVLIADVVHAYVFASLTSDAHPAHSQVVIADVVHEFMSALWALLRPGNPMASKALYILGKLGGHNRRFLKDPLKYVMLCSLCCVGMCVYVCVSACHCACGFVCVI